ncbi:hypothetical protein PoB_005321700 [Plakobranchus ocellatus]|uniref:Uncharacterized protein n=1 Tax=Plakobranchus ocellatus TaxID=259542 RepID=A0AAV4C559_9GAST|nr:hypothetical protein PoB_005321700 [Plakobranchus ocellatus]
MISGFQPPPSTPVSEEGHRCKYSYPCKRGPCRSQGRFTIHCATKEPNTYRIMIHEYGASDSSGEPPLCVYHPGQLVCTGSHQALRDWPKVQDELLHHALGYSRWVKIIWSLVL